jgi:hypothetical protein
MKRDDRCADPEYGASKKRIDPRSQAKKNGEPHKCVFSSGALD